jgi:thiamine-monophosphate kinase
MDELAIIARLKEIFSSGRDEDLLVDIGDDAAFFRTSDTNGIAIATDLLTEGTHFRREWSDLYSIGRKAAAANLADIFAMGVCARYLLVAVALRPEDSDAISDLARGIADESALVGARVIGGDISRGTSLTISITALGTSERVVTRSGAREGDALFLGSGSESLPGRSLLGLEQLRRGIEIDQGSIQFHRSPKVSYQRFVDLADFATSLCDISDGILSDAAALARASDVTIEIDKAAIRAHAGFEEIELLAAKLDYDPLLAVVTSGEEHSPLFTADPTREIPNAWQIGRVGPKGDSLLLFDGQPANEAGFRHF